MGIRIDFRYALLESPQRVAWNSLDVSDDKYFDSEYIQGPELDVEDLPLYDDPRLYCPAVERSYVRYITVLVADDLGHYRRLHFTYWGGDSHMVEVANVGMANVTKA